MNAATYYRAIDKDGNVHITENPTDPNLDYYPIEKGRIFSEEEIKEFEVDSDTRDKRHSVATYRRLGRDNMRRKEYLKAANNFLRVLEFCKALKDVSCQSVAFNDLGNAFRAMGDINQADSMLKQASDVLSKP